jgi:CspA family cold shock protein
MATGTVKWFSNVKGYGFVNTDDNQNEDIFVHFSAIEMDGYKKLTSGQKIEFDINEGPKGLQAQNIRTRNNN